MLRCLFALRQHFSDVHECVWVLPMQNHVISHSFFSLNVQLHVFVVTMATEQNFKFVLLFSLLTR